MPNEASKDGEVEECFVFSQEACQRLEELQQILGVSDKVAVVREGLIRLDTSVFGNETSLLPDLFRSLLPQVLDQAETAEAESSAPTNPAEPAAAAGVYVSFKFDKQAYARIKLLKERLNISKSAEVIRRGLVLLDNEVNAQA